MRVKPQALLIAMILLGVFYFLLPKEEAAQQQMFFLRGASPETTNEDSVIDWGNRQASFFNPQALGQAIDDLTVYSRPEELITLADLVVKLPPPDSSDISIDEINWRRVAELAGVGNWELMQAAYLQAQIPRNFKGYAATDGEKGKVFPWQYVVAMASGETNLSGWENPDPRNAGPWGYNSGYAEAATAFPIRAGDTGVSYLNAQSDRAETLSWTAKQCRAGLETIANSPDVQAKWPGIKAWEIKTSSACAVGRTQVLAVHFAPGQMFAGMTNHNVWTDETVIAETTIIHLVGKSSRTCGGSSWFATESTDIALCTYNPGAWGDPRYVWYFDVIRRTSENIEAALTMHMEELREAKRMRDDPGKRIGAPCRDCYQSFSFGTYPYTQSFINMGVAGSAHNGTDFIVSGIQPFKVYAVCKGAVETAYSTWSAGFIVALRCSNDSTYVAKYYHLDVDQEHATKGPVELGDLIGTANGSGYYSDGAHLHFQWEHNGVPMDAAPYIDWTLTP